MVNSLLVLFGKLLIKGIKILNIGGGSTWPGHIALKINPNFVSEIIKNTTAKKIVIAGTNGKTTTGRLVTSIIRENKKTYLQNKAGANLLNGLASAIIKGAEPNGNLLQDYLIFESDEFFFPQVLEQVKPDYVFCLNLFRDQLDRYGEIDSIAKRWGMAFTELSNKTTLILNADDPVISYLSNNVKAKTLFFGLDEKSELNSLKHGADSIYCPKCSHELKYNRIYFSHLGDWKCPNCGLARPELNVSNISFYPLAGTYNKYNTLAAYLFGKADAIKDSTIKSALETFTPAFGRQEERIYKEKKIKFFLSKNPTSFNESLQTIKELGGRNLLILLNDRIPDGLDVSWIWDIGFERILENDMSIWISGDRVFDMALRLRYSDINFSYERDLNKSLNLALSKTAKEETLYILPTYSAMLDLRKIIGGSKLS